MFFFMQILSIGGAFQAFCFEILPIFGRRSPCVDSYFSSVFKPPFKRYPSFSVEFSKETNTVLFFSGVRNNNITRKKQSKYDIIFLGFQPLCFLCFFVEVQFKKNRPHPGIYWNLLFEYVCGCSSTLWRSHQNGDVDWWSNVAGWRRGFGWGVDPGLVGQIWTWISQKQTTRGCRIFQGSRTDILKDSYRCRAKCLDWRVIFWKEITSKE